MPFPQEELQGIFNRSGAWRLPLEHSTAAPTVDAGVPMPWVWNDMGGSPHPDCVVWDIGAYTAQGLPSQGIGLPLVLRVC